MNEFSPVLRKLRQERPEMFAEEALLLETEHDLAIDVHDIEVPTETELRNREGWQIDWDESQAKAAREGPDLQLENESFEDSLRARQHREGFENRPSVVDMERLAVYRPFHLYPDGHWGVLFFELSMKRFADWLHREARKVGLNYSWDWTLKIATYAVARHAVMHYLTELEALNIELKEGRRVYLPYWDNVYKRTYPSVDCIEETIATVWYWDNAVMRSPVALKKLYQGWILKSVGGAYRLGANFDHRSIRATEDRLAAQVHKCVPKPNAPPPVWGILPRPYVQPWTRYENIPFMMTRSAGGELGRLLNAKPLRRMMRVYHR